MVLGILVGGGWGRWVVLGMCVTMVGCGLGMGLGLGICETSTSQVSGRQMFKQTNWGTHQIHAIICKSEGPVIGCCKNGQPG